MNYIKMDEKIMTKKEKTPVFDWMKTLEDLEISNMIKTGVKTYITKNNKIPKSQKDLEKTIDDFLKLKIGD